MLGPVASISFEQTIFLNNDDARAAGEKFDCGTFFVSTTLGSLLRVNSAFFYELSANNRRGCILIEGFQSSISSVCLHPKQPHCALTTSSGHLQIWNQEKRTLLHSQFFSKLRPTILKFSFCGNHLLVGFSNGILKIMTTEEYLERSSFRPSKTSSSHVSQFIYSRCIVGMPAVKVLPTKFHFAFSPLLLWILPFSLSALMIGQYALISQKKGKALEILKIGYQQVSLFTCRDLT
ncbi:hypothetical protein IE077_003321 [Cardiosporidium cionae]|uniref:Uncharacterized protein n=1 Tax=Cardiosporidium cionae TaxID=476202 RepID=A0ABQ7J8J8_9APIC|nr:hypothetical protein IE077_003321 [Cardiosporidium cionae]|eukprot:KAF8820302.1 hypothetical protein IE077_003321 [Cardiosporidium cionae]